MKKIFVFLVLAVVFAFSVPVSAAILDFNIDAVNPGTVSYAGGTSPLVISGQEVDTLVGLGTPLHDGETLTCTGCVLSFVTGNFTSASSGVFDSWNFAGGGSFTLLGSISGILPANSVIATGTVGPGGIVLSNGMFAIAAAVVADTKNPLLLDYFGMPNVNYEGALNLQFMLPTGVQGGDAFQSVASLSGDFSNTPTPEPGTMCMLGAGAGILVFVRRFRNSRG